MTRLQIITAVALLTLAIVGKPLLAFAGGVLYMAGRRAIHSSRRHF